MFLIQLNNPVTQYIFQSAVARQHRMSAALAESVSYLPAASEATGISYVQDWTANLQVHTHRSLSYTWYNGMTVRHSHN